MTEHGPVSKAHYPSIHKSWRAFYDAHPNRPHYPADDFKAGYRAGMDAARNDTAALEAALTDLSAALSQAIAAPLRTDVQMPADKNTWVGALLQARGTPRHPRDSM